MDVEKSSLCNCVVNFLIEENYLLSAFELLHELLDDGRDAQAIRLKEFFANTFQFPPDQISRFNTLRVADPQTLLEEKETVEEKLAISEYELRLAQEDIVRLKEELQKRTESSTDELNGSKVDAPVGEGLTFEQGKRNTCFSDLGPLKDNERRDLNCAIKEFLLLAGYRLTAMTFYEEQLYQKALSIKSAIPHPRIMGIIHECGGKMHMAERQWAEAATDFFEAFKNYDEAGNQRRIQCLKYLVLANMLMESEVNPFDGQEAKPYKNDPEILAMTNLIAAYQRNEILEFEKILKSNRRTIMDDPFIRNYIEDLLKNIRTQVLLKLIKPYTRIRIPFISKIHLTVYALKKVHAFLLQLVIIKSGLPTQNQLAMSGLAQDLFIDRISALCVLCGTILNSYQVFQSKNFHELNVPEKDVEQLLVSLILDNRIQGHIDQVNRLLERGDRSKGTKKYSAVEKWNTQLKSLYQTVSNRIG